MAIFLTGIKDPAGLQGGHMFSLIMFKYFVRKPVRRTKPQTSQGTF